MKNLPLIKNSWVDEKTAREYLVLFRGHITKALADLDVDRVVAENNIMAKLIEEGFNGEPSVASLHEILSEVRALAKMGTLVDVEIPPSRVVEKPKNDEERVMV